MQPPNVKVFVLGVCRPDFKNPLRLNHNEVLGIYIHTFGLLGCKHSPVSKKIVGQRQTKSIDDLVQHLRWSVL